MIAAITPALGFVSELYRPSVMAFVADVVAPEHRVMAYGRLYWAVNLGFSIAPLAAGLIAGWSYRALFIGDAATTAAYGVLVLAKVPETKPARVAHAPRVNLSTIVRDRAFLIFWLLTFAVGVVMYQSTSALSGWMASQGHGERAFGAVVAVNGIVIVLFQPAITRLVSRFEPRRVLAVAALLAGAGMSLHGVSAWIPMHVLAVVIWTLGEVAAAPTSSAMIANLAPPDARGRYQGVFGMAFGAAASIGPLAGTHLLDAAGPLALWGGCLAIGAIAAAGFTSSAPSRS